MAYRLHFHQHDAVSKFVFLAESVDIWQPIATIMLVPLITAPQALGVFFWDDFLATVWGSLFVCMLFVATSVVGINLAKKSRGLS